MICCSSCWAAELLFGPIWIRIRKFYPLHCALMCSSLQLTTSAPVNSLWRHTRTPPSLKPWHTALATCCGVKKNRVGVWASKKGRRSCWLFDGSVSPKVPSSAWGVCLCVTLDASLLTEWPFNPSVQYCLSLIAAPVDGDQGRRSRNVQNGIFNQPPCINAVWSFALRVIQNGGWKPAGRV